MSHKSLRAKQNCQCRRVINAANKSSVLFTNLLTFQRGFAIVWNGQCGRAMTRRLLRRSIIAREYMESHNSSAGYIMSCNSRSVPHDKASLRRIGSLRNVFDLLRDCNRAWFPRVSCANTTTLAANRLIGSDVCSVPRNHAREKRVATS